MNLFLNIIFAYFVASFSVLFSNMELRLTGDDLVMVFLFSLLPVLYKMFKMPILNPEIIRNKYRIILKEEGRRS
jgi:hypothetical protein